MKKINIDNKEYIVECSAYTYITYPKLFKNTIFEDIDKIKNFVNMITLKMIEAQKNNLQLNDEEAMLLISKELSNEDIQNYLEAVLKITYALIYTYDNKTEEYDLWLKNIKYVDINSNWITEITDMVFENFIDHEVSAEIKKK